MTTVLTTILQSNPSAGGGGLSLILMLVLMFAVMYFFMIAPQNKRRKELEKFRSELKKGDKIVTVGGIYGKICDVKEKTVLISVDGGETKLTVDKNSIVKDYSDVQA